MSDNLAEKTHADYEAELKAANEIVYKHSLELARLKEALEQANDRQIILIHFITHQIKGFVTKSRYIFAGALEGDYGPLSPELKSMVQIGFDSDTQGVNTIQEILNASNIKSGKVTYTMAPFDLKELIEEITAGQKTLADAKDLALKLDLGSEPITMNGDRAQLVNVFKNLIDNSIKYTQKGEVDISIKKESGKVVFEIQDTGVGITPEDMKNLFTEGGHGKDSAKVNVESTGFGLYIVKNIIEAHKGKVWAESEGAGKGSRFIVELPA
jgi:signal transduction histidine kinase